MSKSISSGWKSVVKETSKAAKSVGKAASEAMGPQKPKRKKSSKRKSDPEAATGPDGDPAAMDGASAKADKKQAKPDPAKTLTGKTEPGKKPRRPADEPASAAATAGPDDDGPPVPLVRDPVPQDGTANLAPRKSASPASRDATPRRLPPPPAVPAAAPVERRSPATWTASTADDDATAPPRANVLPRNDARGSPADKAAPDSKIAPAPPAAKPLPITMIPPKDATAGAAAPPDAWTKEEIDTARANCTAILQNVDAVTVPEAPVREGACGAPAPVRLVSIGKNPAVTLQPQPLVTCDLVAGLSQWIKNDIQPLAKKHLGASIAKIETMSDYSCRMAYGRKGNKLSEHGRANALDIRGFITAKGETAHVLEQWGKTERDRVAEAARVAAEQAAAERAAEAAAAAGSKSAVATVSATGGAGAAQRPAPAMASLGATGLKPAQQTRAEKAAALIVPEAPNSKRAQFLRDAHASACRIFGTSLGPESNEAHRNHFHVDMATRKRSKICE